MTYSAICVFFQATRLAAHTPFFLPSNVAHFHTLRKKNTRPQTAKATKASQRQKWAHIPSQTESIHIMMYHMKQTDTPRDIIPNKHAD